MIDDFNQGIAAYMQKWQVLVAARKDKEFFEAFKPTAVCWKVGDETDLDRRVSELRGQAEHIHWARLNDRWVVTAYLREPLALGIRIAKVYQRRPASSDALGLDHVDFYAPEVKEDVLAAEPDLTWTHESNGELCKWISLWFAETEAKLRDNTTLDIEAAELTQASKKVTGK